MCLWHGVGEGGGGYVAIGDGLLGRVGSTLPLEVCVLEGGSKKLICKDLQLVTFMMRYQCCSAFLYNSNALLTENLSAGHAGDGCSCCLS